MVLVRSEKYNIIDDCYFLDIFYWTSLKFVCNNLFSSNTHSVQCKHFSQEKTKIHSIRIEDCERPQISSNFFNDYENLQYLNISHLKLSSLQTYNFAKLKNLIEFIASYNQINEIDLETLANSKLKVFDLSVNNISRITTNTFENLIELEQLNLSYNQIKEIPILLFHKTEHLVQVDFSFNKITEINGFAFSGQFKLKRLNLSNNQITNLHKKIFEDQPELEYLNLSVNSIQKMNEASLVNLIGLNFLNLSRNCLAELKPRTFSSLTNLKTLDLSHNKLKTLDAYSLPLEWNNLDLNSLHLGNNQLQELSRFESINVHNIKFIGIDSNEFNCSYLSELLNIFTWKHLNSVSKLIECSSEIERTRHHDFNEQFTSTEAETSEETDSISSTETDFHSQTEKSEQKPETRTESERNYVKIINQTHHHHHYSTAVDSSTTGWLMINSICLIFIVIGFIWLLLKKGMLKREASKVLYHRNDNEI